MERPKVLYTLAKISLILAIAAVIIALLIFIFPQPALRLVMRSSDITPRDPDAVRKMYLMDIFSYLPLLILSAANMNGRKLSYDRCVLTIIVIAAMKLINFFMSFGSNYVLSRSGADGLAVYAGLSSARSMISGSLSGIGCTLLICAVAIELYEISRRKKEQGAESSGKITD